jgi:hypothetical protein
MPETKGFGRASIAGFFRGSSRSNHLQTMSSASRKARVASVNPRVSGDVPHSFNFIDILQEKQTVLKQVVDIARTIEEMREALEALVVLGQPSTDLPREMLTFFQALSAKTERQPTDKIKRYLMELEDITNEGVQEILEFAHADPDVLDWEEQQADQALLSEQVQKMIREFQRRAKTAVSLKILLQRRGIDTPGATIPVPLSQIREQLVKLEMKEQRQRGMVKRQISEIREDLQRMLGNELYPEGMKSVLRNVLKGLEKDLRVITAGGRLGDLNFSFERVETGEPSRPAPASAPDTVLDQSDTERQPPVAGGKRIGFFRRLWLWLNTPWGVTWKRLKRGK